MNIVSKWPMEYYPTFSKWHFMRIIKYVLPITCVLLLVALTSIILIPIFKLNYPLWLGFLIAYIMGISTLIITIICMMKFAYDIIYESTGKWKYVFLTQIFGALAFGFLFQSFLIIIFMLKAILVTIIIMVIVKIITFMGKSKK